MDRWILNFGKIYFSLIQVKAMRKKELSLIVKYLERVLRILDQVEISDKKLRERYAEYLVALELLKRGHKVQILDEREDKSADIYLPDKGKRVEVKTGLIDEDGYADASFGLGKQIIQKKFDYCVFVTFEGHKPKEFIIFTHGELREEVKKMIWRGKRKEFGAAHPKTNPCLLCRYPTYEEYKRKIPPKYRLKVEKNLHMYPERYVGKWSKIK